MLLIPPERMRPAKRRREDEPVESEPDCHERQKMRHRSQTCEEVSPAHDLERYPRRENEEEGDGQIEGHEPAEGDSAQDHLERREEGGPEGANQEECVHSHIT